MLRALNSLQCCFLLFLLSIIKGQIVPGCGLLGQTCCCAAGCRIGVCEERDPLDDPITCVRGTEFGTRVCVPCGSLNEPECVVGAVLSNRYCDEGLEVSTDDATRGLCIPVDGCGAEGNACCTEGDPCSPASEVACSLNNVCMPCGSPNSPACSEGLACEEGLAPNQEGLCNECGSSVGTPCCNDDTSGPTCFPSSSLGLRCNTGTASCAACGDEGQPACEEEPSCREGINVGADGICSITAAP